MLLPRAEGEDLSAGYLPSVYSVLCHVEEEKADVEGEWVRSPYIPTLPPSHAAFQFFIREPGLHPLLLFHSF